MCKLSKQEENVLVNLRKLKRSDLAKTLGLSPKTIDAYLSRVKRKREECKVFLEQTNRYKSLLYKKRRGE